MKKVTNSTHWRCSQYQKFRREIVLKTVGTSALEQSGHNHEEKSGRAEANKVLNRSKAESHTQTITVAIANPIEEPKGVWFPLENLDKTRTYRKKYIKKTAHLKCSKRTKYQKMAKQVTESFRSFNGKKIIPYLRTITKVREPFRQHR